VIEVCWCISHLFASCGGSSVNNLFLARQLIKSDMLLQHLGRLLGVALQSSNEALLLPLLRILEHLVNYADIIGNAHLIKTAQSHPEYGKKAAGNEEKSQRLQQLTASLLRTHEEEWLINENELMKKIVETPGVCAALQSCLSCQVRSIAKEAAHILSNIAAAQSESVVNTLVGTPGLMQALLQVFLQAEFALRKEIAHVFSNIASGNQQLLSAMVEAGVLQGFVLLLKAPDNDMKHLSLLFLEESLRNGPAKARHLLNADADSLFSDCKVV